MTVRGWKGKGEVMNLGHKGEEHGHNGIGEVTKQSLEAIQ